MSGVRLVCVCARDGRSCLYECLGSGLCVCVQGTGEAALGSTVLACVCVCVCKGREKLLV